MDIEKVTIRGAKGIQRGMGLDEVTIDFKGMTGLVAFSGPCGTGKTTVLDNMHPFLSLPSRKGALHHHFYLKDSFRDLGFRMGGTHYQSKIFIDSNSGRGEAFLYENHSTSSVVDGKFGAYKKAITEIMGSEALFFNSVFCAQNTKKMSEIRTGKLRDLMAEFLGLWRLQAHEKTSGKCVSMVESALSTLVVKIEALQRSIDDCLVTRETLENAGTQIADLSRKYKSTWAWLTKKKEALQGQQEIAKDSELTNQKLNTIAEQIETIRKAKAKAREDRGIKLSTFRLKLEDADRELTQQSEIIAAEPDIHRAQNRMIVIDTDLKTAREDKERLQNQLTLTTGSLTIANQVSTKLRARGGEIDNDITQCEELLKTEGLVKQAKERISELNATLLDAREKKTVTEKQISDINAQLNEHNQNHLQIVSDRAQAISEVAARITAAETKHAQADHNLNDLNFELSLLDSDAELTSVNQELTYVNQQADALEERDPLCTSTTCKFIINAVKAKALIPGLEDRRQSRIATIAQEKEVLRHKSEVFLNKKHALVTELESLSFERNNVLTSYDGKIDGSHDLGRQLAKKHRDITRACEQANMAVAELQLSLEATQAMAEKSGEIIATKERLSILTKNRSELIKDAGYTETDTILSALAQNMAAETELAGKQKAISAKINSLALSIKKMLAELETAQTMAAKAGDLASAKQAVTFIENLKAGIQVNIDDIENDHSVCEAVLEAELKELSVKNAALLTTATEQHKAYSEITTLQADIAGLEQAMEQASRQTTEKRTELVQLKKEFDRKESQQAKLDALVEKRGVLLTEAAQWTYARNGCSKTGLQALELAAVAPSISNYANNLLLSTFGPGNTLKVATLDDTGKEVLDFVVTLEDGEEVLLDLFSGGEQVWLHKAARLALTMVSKEKSGRAFNSCMLDEEDGALDEHSAQDFISLYRQFMIQGGFKTNFFISHKPVCVAMADRVIEFTGHGVEY
jgi:DNA repair exonuclease SbcCD ATPase subunit